MIHVRLAGGLGNQLFQLCAALAVARNRTPVRLYLDALGRYRQARDPDILRLLDLEALCVSVAPVSGMAGLAIERLRIGRLLPRGGINDRNFAPQLQADVHRGFAVLDGYFQNQWNWESMRPAASLIRNALQDHWKLSPQPTLDCAVHVRGSDFLKSALHQIVTPAFYAEGFATLLARREVRDVIVVTDDHDHAQEMLAVVRQNHPSVRFEFSHPGDPLEDFRTLLHATDRLIGNSTFSWWAAALGRSDGMTVSPGIFARGMGRQPALPNEIVLPVANQ